MECSFCKETIQDGAIKCIHCDSILNNTNSQTSQQYNCQKAYNEFSKHSLTRIKNQTSATVICLLFGGLGIHKFYIGRIWLGVLYLIFCWTGIPGIISSIEALFIVYSNPNNWAIKYNNNIIGSPVQYAIKGLVTVVSIFIFIFYFGITSTIIHSQIENYNNAAARAKLNVQSRENDAGNAAQSLESATSNNSVPSPQQALDGSAKIVKIRAKIHTSLPEYQFIIYGQRLTDGMLYSAHKIEIRDEKQQLIQTIILKEATETPDGVNLGFVLEDMNFDGYKDFRIQTFQPAHENIPYAYWLWNKDKAEFVSNHELEEILSPKFDAKHSLISSEVQSSATISSSYIYKYINGVLKLIKETTKEYDENYVCHITVKEFINGRMIITKK